ncbi:hypothetical protein [Paenimyroides baculatum]|uniref:Tail fiber domain-containing protein n=1 Tax=Paenimyroides baculatum TaxID=2608000 RepID=A0A5M6CG37_9FLAO|nr:hypothetical protein [Paenimyroides baculatum]KAA5532882.1 hypothetical protein F0460_12605 [Paenimyroides baculatum]
MKNKIFTLALTLMGSSLMFAQQWTGTNNTTSNISRTGKVSINTTKTDDNLNVFSTIGLTNPNALLHADLDINFYSSIILGGAATHKIATRAINYTAPNPFGSGTITTQTSGLYLGSIVNKTFVVAKEKIGIGTDKILDCADCADYRLFVKNGIRTEKIKVDIAANNGWADYVFEPDYNLMPLTQVEQFIKQNGHLPEVPTTAEAIANGIELKEMNILLLKKVEELTLYSIELQKRIEALESKNN